MIKNYLKIAWRNLYKNKVFSLIHILGLTIGITVCMMIFLYVGNEFSVDKFHSQGKNIYRVMRGFRADALRVPYLSGPYGPALLNDFPNEIKQAVRVQPNSGLISFGDKAFAEKNMYVTDPDFFTLFSFPLLKGDPATVLKEPNSIVLTEKLAKKYFGSVDKAMGKIVKLDKNNDLKVTGVAKNVPSNSHLFFDLIIPIANEAKQDGFNVWMNNSMFVYLRLNDHVTPAQLTRQFPQFVNKYLSADMARMRFHVDLALTPLSDVYFEPASSFDNVKHGDKAVVYIFISIAILIMLIACINFMNLSTVRAVERSKEVGLRKVMGAMRNHLIFQFIGESLLLALISCTLAVGLLFLLMPKYNELLGYTLTVQWNSWPIYAFLAGVILVVGFLAGSYPAFFLSAFSPIQALKSKLQLNKGAFFRQSLVILQFCISVLLIVGTIVINKQMSYVKNKKLGYDQAQIAVISIDNNDIYNNRQAFKHDLQNNTNIQSVSLMSGEPGGFHDIHNFNVEGQADPFKSRTEFADFEFVKTLGLKIIAGRDFSPQLVTDSAKAILINRTAAQRLGFSPQQAIGKWIKDTGRDTVNRTIVGVVEDYNFLSLKEHIDALVISPLEDRRVILVKLKPGNIQAGMDAIKAEYTRVAPVYPFEYTFLDQKFDTEYKTDIRQQTILNIFSGLAIFIACLGLFGLASFTAAQRTKEIGVRKVLGSSVQNIVFLLSRDLLKPVLIATIIALPLGYLCMNKWLQNFAYRTPLSWYIFFAAAALTFIIAIITVSFRSVKAALANPVKSLRSE